MEQNEYLNLITSGQLLEGMNLLVENFQKESDPENIIKYLSEFFYHPNKETFNNRFKKNKELLEQYPYLLSKKFTPPTTSPFLIFPVSEETFYFYHKENRTFTKKIVRTERESKYFFENIENPLFVEDEFNEYNLQFLVDNLRASEDISKDNHIYLYYQREEEFSLLLYYMDFAPLLEKEKLVFLIGEKEKQLYPLPFKERFGIDYEAMEFQEVRPEEIKRLLVQFQLQGPSGTTFANHILQPSEDILYRPYLFYDNISYFLDASFEHMLHPDFKGYLEEAIEKQDFSILEIFFKPFRQKITTDQDFFQEIDRFMIHLNHILDHSTIETYQDWLKICYLSFHRALGKKEPNSRITPAIYHIIHRVPFLVSDLTGSVIMDHRKYQMLMTHFFKFPYVYIYSTLRDPLSNFFSEIDRGLGNNKTGFDGKSLFLRSYATLFAVDGFVRKHIESKNKESKEYECRRVFLLEHWKLNPVSMTTAFFQFLNLPFYPEYIQQFDNNKDLMRYYPDLAIGYSVKSLYKNMDDYLTKEEIAFVEMMFYPYYQMYGYEPMYYDGTIYSKEEIDHFIETPFLFETIYTKGKPQEVIDTSNHYRRLFIAEGLRFKLIMESMAKKEEILPFTVVHGDKNLWVNHPYRNIVSLPQLEDVTTAHFLNAPLLYKNVETKLHKKTLELITSHQVEKGMDLLVENFSEKTEEPQVIDYLIDCFLAPKLKIFQKNYENNKKLLEKYPYLLSKAVLQTSSPFLIFPISENTFYFYHKENKKFFKKEVNSKTETKYFFENIENPLFVEEEFNEFNLQFLVDNVRTSEAVAKDNHIYLYYQKEEEFSLLMYYMDFAPLLEKEKTVFLIGEKEKQLYPLPFKERFDIDYEAMEFQEVRPEEIKRILILLPYNGYSGHRFLCEVFDNSPALFTITFSFSNFGFEYYFEHGKLIPFSQFLNRAEEFLENKDQKSLSKFFGTSFIFKEIDYFERISVVLSYLREYHEKYPVKTLKDWMLLDYFAMEKYFNKKTSSRIVPMIHHAQYATSPKSLVRQKIEELYESFPYCYKYSPLRHFSTQVLSSTKRYYTNSIFNKGLTNLENVADLKKTLEMAFLGISISFTMERNIKEKGTFFLVRFEDLKLNPKATISAFCSKVNIPNDTNFLGKTLLKDRHLLTLPPENPDNDIFKVATLYKNQVDFDIFSKEDRIFLNILFEPFFSYYGYQSEYLHDIPQEQWEYILQSKKQEPFAFESKLISIIQEHSPHVFTEEQLKEMIAKEREARLNLVLQKRKNYLKKNTHANISVLSPTKELIVNTPYQNQASLPELKNLQENFLNTPYIFSQEVDN